MDELRKKHKLRKRFYSKTTLFALLFLMLFLISPTWKIWRKNIDSDRKLEMAKQELAELEKKESELRAEVDLLQSEQGKEQEIRKKYSVTKDGEQVVFLVDRKGETNSVETVEESGFFSRIWHWFTGLFSKD